MNIDSWESAYQHALVANLDPSLRLSSGAMAMLKRQMENEIAHKKAREQGADAEAKFIAEKLAEERKAELEAELAEQREALRRLTSEVTN